MKIGITEQGDAGLDFTWFDKLQSQTVDGAVLITKNINPVFINKVLTLWNNGYRNILIHAGCTGLGGTAIEPCVPNYKTQINGILELLKNGFPAEHIILRVDPIIPTTEGLTKVKEMLDYFVSLDTGITNIRISILDEYKHVKERLKKAGFEPFYKDQFYAPQYMMENTKRLLTQYPDLNFWTCAEDRFVINSKLPNLSGSGCIDTNVLELFGLHPDKVMLENMQNRHGCHCLSCKTELLSHKQQCPHKCLYCYWRADN